MASRKSFKIDHNKMLGLKYKTKYRRLKKIVKNYVFENSALCDQIAQIQENITTMKEERRFLLRKLIEYDTENDAQANEQTSIPNKKLNRRKTNADINTKNKTSVIQMKSTTPVRNVYQTSLSVDSQGRPIYPIYIGNLTIHSLGEIIVDNSNFHTENWIYPVGYMTTRVYSHPKEPERKCTFTCKILDNSGIPQFQIIPDSDFDHVFFGETANICHLGLLETIVNSSDSKNTPNLKNLPIQPKGELFFGLGHPTVASLLMALPNSKKCPNFKGFNFDMNFRNEKDSDPTLDFDALQKLITCFSHVIDIVPKEEPPDELLE